MSNHIAGRSQSHMHVANIIINESNENSAIKKPIVMAEPPPVKIKNTQNIRINPNRQN